MNSLEFIDKGLRLFISGISENFAPIALETTLLTQAEKVRVLSSSDSQVFDFVFLFDGSISKLNTITSLSLFVTEHDC